MVAAVVAALAVVVVVAAPAHLAEAAGADLEADVEGLAAAHVEPPWIWAHLSELLDSGRVSLLLQSQQA